MSIRRALALDAVGLAVAVGGSLAGISVARLLGVPTAYGVAVGFSLALPFLVLGTHATSASFDFPGYVAARWPRELIGHAVAVVLAGSVTGVLATVALVAAGIGGSLRGAIAIAAVVAGGLLLFQLLARDFLGSGAPGTT